MKIEWHVGDVVKKLRESAELTQEQLAMRAKLRRPATIGAIESTGKCRQDTLKSIAAAFNLRDADLLALVPYEPTKVAPIQDAHAYVCSNPDHKKLHQLLDEILEGKRDDAHEWRAGIIANLKAMRLAAIVGDTPPELKNATGWTRKPVPRKKGNEGV